MKKIQSANTPIDISTEKVYCLCSDAFKQYRFNRNCFIR